MIESATKTFLLIVLGLPKIIYLLISDQKQVTLQIRVEYHQQALTYYCSDTVEFWTSKAYRAEYDRMDISSSLKWSAEASLAEIGSVASSVAASGAYGEVNSLITNHEGSHYLKEGEEKGFNGNELQIIRRMVTSVAIGGKITTVKTKSYIDSVPISDRWTPERRRHESREYLCYRFYPREDCKIPGSTYTTHTCQNKNKACYQSCPGIGSLVGPLGPFLGCRELCDRK